MTPVRKKRLLIADDHALLAEGMASLLSAEYDVVGIAPDGRRLIDDAIRLRPELVVLDINMPELNGIEAARQLQVSLPESKLIFVTQQIEPEYLRAAFHAGALGYVVKQAASAELMMALRLACTGKTYISPMIQEKFGFAPVSELRGDGTPLADTLTSRQREVLQLIAEGRTTRHISASLHISSKTVEFHKKTLMDQTGLRTTAELTRYAIANRVVSL